MSRMRASSVVPGSAVNPKRALLLTTMPSEDTAFKSLGKLRYVVEQAFALLHQFTRLAIRWERRLEPHDAFVSLACSLICWQRAGNGSRRPTHDPVTSSKRPKTEAAQVSFFPQWDDFVARVGSAHCGLGRVTSCRAAGCSKVSADPLAMESFPPIAAPTPSPRPPSPR